jgi:hypothetical protein
LIPSAAGVVKTVSGSGAQRFDIGRGFHVKQFGAYVRVYQRNRYLVLGAILLLVREAAILVRANDGALAKRQHPLVRLRNEGERLNDWRAWNLRGNGHPDGLLELAGEHTC